MSDRTMLTSPQFRASQRLQQAANDDPPMRRGEQGEAVKLLQQALLDRGYNLPISTQRSGAPDGMFGPETFHVLQSFQTAYGLAHDGIAGRFTLTLLDELQAQSNPNVRVVADSTCEARAAGTARIYADYVELVRCAEQLFEERHWSPRRFLSLLRQVYYSGSLWSLLIPCGVMFPASETLRGKPLLTALERSQVVSDRANNPTVTTDIGHVLAGLEAMCCSFRTTELFENIPLAVVEIPNEAVATWLGDLGSAVTDKAVADDRAGFIQPWERYFGFAGKASFADLEGDIDAYLIRAVLTGRSFSNSASVRLRSEFLNRPLSQILHEYYLASNGPLAEARTLRYEGFVQAIGGQVRASQIENLAELIAVLTPMVLLFSRLWLVKEYGSSYDPSNSAGLEASARIFLRLERYAEEIVHLFVAWLEQKLAGVSVPPSVDLRGGNSRQARAFFPETHSIEGRVRLVASVRNHQGPVRYRWSVEPAWSVQFGSPNEAETDVRALSPGLATVHVEVQDATSSKIIDTGSTRVCVPQFVVVREERNAFEGWLYQVELGDARDALLPEMRQVSNFLLRTINVRLVWQLSPYNEALPRQFEADGAAPGNYTVATLAGYPPSNHYGDAGFTTAQSHGRTRAEVLRAVPRSPDDIINIWPGGFMQEGGKFQPEIKLLVDRLRSLQVNDTRVKMLAITIFGRLLGMALAHEVLHSTLDYTKFELEGHNYPPIGFDIMNQGFDQSWTALTGIELIDRVAFPAPGSYRDGGIDAMVTLRARTQHNANRFFPVPPVFH